MGVGQISRKQWNDRNATLLAVLKVTLVRRNNYRLNKLPPDGALRWIISLRCAIVRAVKLNPKI